MRLKCKSCGALLTNDERHDRHNCPGMITGAVPGQSGPTWTRMTVRATELEEGDLLWFRQGPAEAVASTWRDDFDEQVFVKLVDYRWPFMIPVDEHVEIQRAV